MRVLSLFVFGLLLIGESSLAAPNEPLSAGDQKILDQGEMSTGKYIAGGLYGIFPGFGAGHYVQDRFKEKGFIFAVGESSAFALMTVAPVIACGGAQSGNVNCALPIIWTGALAFLGFKGWEIYDVWITPLGQNARWRKLKNQDTATFSPYVLPNIGGGMTAGLAIGF